MCCRLNFTRNFISNNEKQFFTKFHDMNVSSLTPSCFHRQVCLRGRHVFMGYLKNEEKTHETMDEEGWLHSGDIGKLDKVDFLH